MTELPRAGAWTGYFNWIGPKRGSRLIALYADAGGEIWLDIDEGMFSYSANRIEVVEEAQWLFLLETRILIDGHVRKRLRSWRSLWEGSFGSGTLAQLVAQLSQDRWQHGFFREMFLRAGRGEDVDSPSALAGLAELGPRPR